MANAFGEAVYNDRGACIGPAEERRLTIITAIYENGVFRPTEPVDLPEGTTVLIEPAVDVRTAVPPGTPESVIRVYEILARRYDGGSPDTAERVVDTPAETTTHPPTPSPAA